LQYFHLIEKANVLVILQALDAPLQVARNFRKLLYCTNAFHKETILQQNEIELKIAAGCRHRD
jgi:hypothetical protein